MFNGAYQAYAPCGYTPPQFRSAYEAASRQFERRGRDRRHHRRLRAADDRAGREHLRDAPRRRRRSRPASSRRASRATSRPRARVRRPPAGPARRRSTSRPCTAWRPAPNVRYYGAQSCLDDDIADTLRSVVDENQASIVTNSCGDPESDATPATRGLRAGRSSRARMQGIGVLLLLRRQRRRAGQHAARMQADYPASDPYVTAVGGTSTGDRRRRRARVPDRLGHGEVRAVGRRQSVDAGAVPVRRRRRLLAAVQPPRLPERRRAGGDDAGRAVPDVALDADPNTGMLVGETQVFPRRAGATASTGSAARASPRR